MGLISRKRLGFGDGSLEIDVVPEMLVAKILGLGEAGRALTISTSKKGQPRGGAPLMGYPV
jgi:hypothetical protein